MAVPITCTAPLFILLLILFILLQRNCIEVTVLPSSGDLFEGEDDAGDSGEKDGGDNANPPLRGVIHNAGVVADAIQDAKDPDSTDDTKSHCRTDANTCGPDVECEFGSCCSQWGWCGWTAAHCGKCCQSNCWSS